MSTPKARTNKVYHTLLENKTCKFSAKYAGNIDANLCCIFLQKFLFSIFRAAPLISQYNLL